MDRKIHRDPRKRWVKIGTAAMLVACAGLFVWRLLPRGVAVTRSGVTIATVESGTFRDELVNRASVMPLATVVLDATEGGRVEAVLTRDGTSIKKGELLFRLSNPQREQEVLARDADVAQQLANLSAQRAELAASRANARREIAGLEYDLDRYMKAYRRDAQLAEQGFIAASALEESSDRVNQQRRLLAQAQADRGAELDTREQSVKQLGAAITRLDAGLKLLRASTDGLIVRAPADGVLTGFQLQEGQSVKLGDHLGRIDTADRFKLTARVDEFYLSRIAPGLKGRVDVQGQPFAVTSSHLNPEIKDGRFTIELLFNDRMPSGLQPGLSLEVHLTLGKSGNALLLSDGAFYADSGGAWVFVLDADGQVAQRRSVRLGRRAAGQIEVLDGLKPGEQVIVSGYKRFAEADRIELSR